MQSGGGQGCEDPLTMTCTHMDGCRWTRNAVKLINSQALSTSRESLFFHHQQVEHVAGRKAKWYLPPRSLSTELWTIWQIPDAASTRRMCLLASLSVSCDFSSFWLHLVAMFRRVGKLQGYELLLLKTKVFYLAHTVLGNSDLVINCSRDHELFPQIHPSLNTKPKLLRHMAIQWKTAFHSLPCS